MQKTKFSIIWTPWLGGDALSDVARKGRGTLFLHFNFAICISHFAFCNLCQDLISDRKPLNSKPETFPPTPGSPSREVKRQELVLAQSHRDTKTSPGNTELQRKYLVA